MADRRTWTDDDIRAALQAHHDKHGRAPSTSDWRRATSEHPNTLTVARRFGSWPAALEAAGLPVTRRIWSEEEILEALRGHSRREGQTPTALDWRDATPEHPAAVTVARRFGSWPAAIKAAGLELNPRSTRTLPR